MPTLSGGGGAGHSPPCLLTAEGGVKLRANHSGQAAAHSAAVDTSRAQLAPWFSWTKKNNCEADSAPLDIVCCALMAAWTRPVKASSEQHVPWILWTEKTKFQADSASFDEL